MGCSLACFLVLVLQVQFIRGQLAQNLLRDGRSVAPEPGYKVGNISNTRGSIYHIFKQRNEGSLDFEKYNAQ